MFYYRDFVVFVSVCVVEYIVYIIYLNCVIEEVFCDVFCV